MLEIAPPEFQHSSRRHQGSARQALPSMGRRRLRAGDGEANHRKFGATQPGQLLE